MKILAIFALVLLVFLRNRFALLLAWVVVAPLATNVLTIPQDNPFFGSYRIVDYEGYLAGSAKHFLLLVDFDRTVLVLLALAGYQACRPLTDARARSMQQWLGWFTVAVLVGAFFSDNIVNAVRKGIDTFGLCYLAFIIGRTYLARETAHRAFVLAIFALGLWLGLSGIVEYRQFGEWNLSKYGDAHRVAGPFRYWETFGMAVVMVGFVAVSEWLRGRGARPAWQRWGIMALAGLMLYSAFRTQTRTILIATSVGLLVVLSRARGDLLSRTFVRNLVLVGLVGGGLLLVAPEVLQGTRFYQNTLKREKTKEGREETYVAAVRMFLAHPFLGIGLKNFQGEMMNYVSSQEVVHSRAQQSSCHSSYLVIAAELGFMGLIPFLGVILAALRLCDRYWRVARTMPDRAWAVSMLGLSFCYFLCGSFFDPFFDPTMQNKLFYMCLGCTAGRLELLLAQTTA